MDDGGGLAFLLLLMAVERLGGGIGPATVAIVAGWSVSGGGIFAGVGRLLGPGRHFVRRRTFESAGEPSLLDRLVYNVHELVAVNQRGVKGR